MKAVLYASVVRSLMYEAWYCTCSWCWEYVFC